MNLKYFCLVARIGKSTTDSSSTALISRFHIIVDNPFQNLVIECNGNCTFTHNGLLYKLINGVVFLLGNSTSTAGNSTATLNNSSTAPIYGV